MATRVIAAQDKTSSGAGDDVQIKAGNANTSGAGGSIILQPGSQVTTGGDGFVQIKGTGSSTILKLTESAYNRSFTWTQDYSGASLSADGGLGGIILFGRFYIDTGGKIRSAYNNYVGLGNSNSQHYDNWGYIYLRNDGVINWWGDAGLTYGSVGTIRVSNASTGGGSLAYTSSTPTALSTNPTNDLVLTGSAFQRLSSSSALSVTGIAPPATGAHVDGRLIWLYNVGSFNITLKHSQTSTAANQFINEGSGDIVLGPGRMVQAIYDSTSSKWRVNGETYPYVFPTADGTNGQVLTTNGSGTLSWTTVSAGASASGTTNYIAKFTGASTLGNSLVYDDGSNVGIGTTSSLGRLDVVGANVYEPIRGITSSASNLESGSNNTLGLSVNNSNTTAGNGIAIGFNTATTNSTLYGVGAIGFNNLTHTTLGVPQGKFQVITRDSGGGLTPKLTIDTSGNVGIGNTAPGTKLEVTGTVRSAASSTAGVLEVGSDGGLTLTRDNSYDLTLAQSSSSSNGLYLSGAGNVYVCIDNNNNETGRKFVVSNNAVKATNEIFYVNEEGGCYVSGNLGVNNTSPGAKLQVDTGATGTKGQIIKAFLGQSANLSEWQNSSGTVNSWINSSGNEFSTNGINLTSYTTSYIKFDTSAHGLYRTNSWMGVGKGDFTTGFFIEASNYGRPNIRSAYPAGNGEDSIILNTTTSLVSSLSRIATFQNNGTTGAYILRDGDGVFSGVRVGVGPGTTSYNTVCGAGAWASNTTGTYSTAIGYNALAANTTGGVNTAIGSFALQSNTTGVYNTAVGYSALGSITTQSYNVAIGRAAISGSTGNNNTAVGSDAAMALTTGSNNVLVGYGVAQALTTGGQNVALGNNCLTYTTTSSGNIAIGWEAARLQADGATALNAGNYNVYIGYNVKGFNNSDTNVIVIGYNAIGKGANTTVIGNTSSTASYVYGDNLYLGNGAGSQVNIRPLARTTSGTGSAIALWGADGVTSGNGGIVYLLGGYGPSGNGGDVFLKGGDSGGGTRDGTIISKVGGNGNYNCHEFRYGIAATYAFFDQLGRFCITPGTSTTAIPADATIYVATRSSATRGLIVKGAATQSANLTEWQDSTGTVVAAVSPTGAFTGSSFTPYGTFNSTTTIFGNNYWTPNYTGGVTSPSAGTYTKSTGNNASWDAQVYSSEGYTKNVYCAARASQTNGYIMFGLNEDTANSSYNTIDYAWYFIGDGGSLSIYENGTQFSGSYGNYTTSTVLSITYDGENVRYWKDGALMRTVARSTGNPLYFDTSFYSVSASLNSVQFGPIGQPFGISGTSGYLPKFTSQQTLGNSVVYDNGGSVGIGTSSPVRLLDLYNATTPVFAMHNSTTGTTAEDGFLIYLSGSDSFIQNKESTGVMGFIVGGNTERMRIDASGNVGVGAGARIGSGTGYLNAGATAAGYLELYNSTSGATTLMNTGAFNVLVGTNNTERIRVTSSGLVGIGTSTIAGNNPLADLHVNDASGYGSLQLSQSPAGATIDTGGEIQFAATYRSANDLTQVARIRGLRENATNNNWAGYLAFYTSTGSDNPSASTERMRINSSGNVGIGTASPLARLDVRSSSAYNAASANIAFFASNEAQASNPLGLMIQQIYSGTRPLVSLVGTRYGLSGNDIEINGDASGVGKGLTVQYQGNVGVGTSSPGAKLQVDTGATGTKGQIIKAFLGQSANLSEWQSSTGTVLTSVDSVGRIGVETAPDSNYSVKAAGKIYAGNDIVTTAGLVTRVNAFDFTFGYGGPYIRRGFSGSGNTLYFGEDAAYQAAFEFSIGAAMPTVGVMRVTASAANTRALVLKAAASPTANLQEWQNSSGTALAYMDGNGNFAAVTKSFLIPHPTPAKAAEGKKLRYASLEGPENGVYFRGRLEGENVIILPDYWVDLVDPDSITVNLTARKFAQPSLFVVDANAERVVIESDRQVCCDFIVYATRKDIAKLEVEPDGN